MKRLVYLYVANGSADINNIPVWSCANQTQESFALNFHTEGFAHLFKEFIRTKLFDEILVVMESNRSPGSMPFAPGITILVVPHIECLWPHLRKDDIMWARGGWRTWWKFLNEWHELDRWLLFYRAASNRGAWTFWDIVLDDLTDKASIDGLGRFYFPINKPMNPTIFKPVQTERIYDLCIGASHVHDKKGQWRILEILDCFETRFERKLKCILPGSIHRGEGTRKLLAGLAVNNVDIITPGMVPRSDMCTIYNQSKLFVHLGSGGQNDRGPLEAMACGTPVMLANEEFHAPFMRTTTTPFSFHVTATNPVQAAFEIYEALELIEKAGETFRNNVLYWFQYKNSIDRVIIPQFTYLFELLKNNDRSNKQEVLEHLLGYNAENALPGQSTHFGSM